MYRPRHARRRHGVVSLLQGVVSLLHHPLAAARRNRKPDLAAAAWVIAPPVLLPVTLPPDPAPVVDREPRMGGAMQNMFDRGAEETSLDLPVISVEDISSEEEARR
jgi:hypothetical protein